MCGKCGKRVSAMPKSKTRWQPPFHPGDPVIVKAGVEDPDLGGNIGGWQGRVVSIEADDEHEWIVMIAWDSLTLQQMPQAMIAHCEEEGLDWTQMLLAASEVEPTTPRDSAAAVLPIQPGHSAALRWMFVGEPGGEASDALADEDGDDFADTLEAWEEYLEDMLTFPFEVVVAEPQDKGPFHLGDQLKVRSIGLVDDLYGIIVDVTVGRRKYAIPLSEVRVADDESPNFQPVENYRDWFANR
jgi:hypothetical protein